MVDPLLDLSQKRKQKKSQNLLAQSLYNKPYEYLDEREKKIVDQKLAKGVGKNGKEQRQKKREKG